MSKNFYQLFLFKYLLLIFIITGCQHNPTSVDNPQPEKGSWTIYTPFDWSHDGAPYEAQYCTIFSDAANFEMKQQVGEIADERFRQIMDLFDLKNTSDLSYPPGYSKLEIYINRNHTEGINWAHWGGFIITIRSSEISGHWYDYVIYTVRHELTHNFEFLIEGQADIGTDFWFKEGIAVYVGCIESDAFTTIKTLGELENWITQNQNIPGQGNPIRIHQSSDFPDGANWHEYYRLFELAMRYLLDENGMGKSFEDVLAVFYDIRNGISFSVSFENQFGISESDYESEFYDRVKVYLNANI